MEYYPTKMGFGMLLLLLLLGVSLNVSSKHMNRTKGPGSRIFSGALTRAGDMPFIGGLAPAPKPEFRRVYCTATLIAPRWALTAAHCKDGEVNNNPDVFLLNTPPETGELIIVGIQNWSIPEDFRPWFQKPAYADFGLLYLNRSVNEIKPVPIAVTDEIATYNTSDYRGMLLTFAGYGFTANNTRSQTLSKTYRYLDVCLPFIQMDYQRGFCTISGPGRESTCRADSGAPIMLETAQAKLLIGVHVGGYSPCTYSLEPWEHPGNHIRISGYIDWIKEKMCEQDGSKIPGLIYECD